jgi:hypothetical protein
MKPTPRRLRTTSNFSERLEQRLRMYALAASATGVGMLALAPPAHAKIIYTNTYHTINMGDQPYPIDLDNNGKPDVYIANTGWGNYTSSAAWVSANPTGRNGVAGSGSAYPLCRGLRIGPGRPFAGKLMARISTGGRFFGQWINAANKYLGIKFYISGKAHYGWARFTFQSGPGKRFTATLKGYAYETVPNKPIVAGKTKGPDEAGCVDQAAPAALNAPNPEPATLGLLAMGFPGLSVWRRKESMAAVQ